MSTTESTTSDVLRITERALEQILDLRNQEEEGEALGLRIEVTGTRGADFTYDRIVDVVPEDPGYDAEYFANRNLDGVPVLIRPVAAVDFA